MELIDQINQAASSEVTWADRWQVYLTAITLLITLYIAYRANHWAMKYWRRQKEEEINYQLDALRYEATLEATKAAWGLLAFLTEKENGICMLIYKGTKEKPEVYFDLDRGRKYLSSLSEIFYAQGHGIFLSRDIKSEIFHVRTNVYKLLDREERREKTTGLVLIENQELVSFFRTSFEKLQTTIKKFALEELQHDIGE